jgi:hypothetical protein
MTRPYLVDLMEIACRDKGMSAALALAEAEAARELARTLLSRMMALAGFGLVSLAMVAAVVGPLGWQELAISSIIAPIAIYVMTRVTGWRRL